MNDKLRKIVAEVLDVAESRVDATTGVETEPKWDSLRHMNIIFAVEDGFGVRFNDDEISLLTSIGAIEKALDSRR